MSDKDLQAHFLQLTEHNLPKICSWYKAEMLSKFPGREYTEIETYLLRGFDYSIIFAYFEELLATTLNNEQRFHIQSKFSKALATEASKGVFM